MAFELEDEFNPILDDISSKINPKTSDDVIEDEISKSTVQSSNDINDLDSVSESQISDSSPESSSPEPPKSSLRFVLFETMEQMVDDALTQKGLASDVHLKRQLMSVIVQSCKPDNLKVNVENLLFEEQIISDILNNF